MKIRLVVTISALSLVLAGGLTACSAGVQSESNCANLIDDDGDGLMDCADPDCAAAMICQIPVCGDDVADGTEFCDGLDIGSQTCAGLGYDTGTLACNTGCTAFDESNCAYDAYCGDGTLNLAEECDGLDFGTTTCESLGFGAGDLACDAALCTIDTTDCVAAPLTICGTSGGNTLDATGTVTCAADVASGEMEFDIYQFDVTAGDCIDIKVDNSPVGAADMVALAVDADGTSYGIAGPGDYTQLDDEWACTTEPWSGAPAGCPEIAVMASSTGTFTVYVAQWNYDGADCAVGLSGYTLWTAVNGTDVAPTQVGDDQTMQP